MLSDWLVVSDCGFSLSALMSSLSIDRLTWVSLYLVRGVSLHGCFRKVQPLLLTLDVG